MLSRSLGVGYALLVLLFLKAGVRAEQTVTLIAAGDLMLGRGVAQALDGSWEAAFSDVAARLQSADVAFANLESSLTTDEQISRGYDLRAHPEAVAALATAGFDAVSVANNHAWDAGEEGLRQTAQTLCQVGIVPVGDLREAAAIGDVVECQGVVVEGVRLLAFDDSGQALDLDAATDLAAAAAESSKPLVVSIHWGGEYQAEPGPRQEAVAATLAASGAALIVGHGPHVLQRVEWVGDTLVAYSLGNFLFDQAYPIDCRWGTMLRVVFRGKRVIYVEAIPTAAERGRVVLAGGGTRGESGQTVFRPDAASPVTGLWRIILSVWRALILGILQGATEFLPVSSSGHLVLVPWLLGWESPSLAFDAVVHWGTAIAVVVYFWRDWVDMIRSGLRSIVRRSFVDDEARLAWLIVLGAMPAAVLGYLLNDFFERLFSQPAVAAGFLLVTAAFLLGSELLGRAERSVAEMNWKDALVVGFAQALAILPGISRSGSTISAGLVRGLRRDTAARYSFLLGTPVILGAGLFKLVDLAQGSDLAAQSAVLLVGFLAAGVVGMGCVHFLLRYLRRHGLVPFAAYCTIVGIGCLIAAAVTGGGG